MLRNKAIVYLSGAAFMGLLSYFFFEIHLGVSTPVFLYVSYIMFVVLSLVGHRLMLGASKKKESYQFVNTYLGITAVKMFLVLVVLTIYLYFNKTHLFQVGIFYALTYLIFLAIDVVLLLKMLRDNSPSII